MLFTFTTSLALQLLSLMDEACALQGIFTSYFINVRDSHLPAVWPEIPDGGAEVIGDAELRVKPSLPEGRYASAIFALRW